MGIRKKLFSEKKNKNSMDGTQRDGAYKNIESIAKVSTLSVDVPEGKAEPVRGGKKEAKSKLKIENMDFLSEACQQIKEGLGQLEELKTEYQAVTSYLTDIQKIERIPVEDRKRLNETARRIIVSSKEKSRYTTTGKNISDVQLKHLAKYEEVLPKELRRIKESEEYRDNIKKDLRYLESEKEGLLSEREEIVSRHASLRGIAIITCILVGILFLVFIWVNRTYEADMQVPFILTVLMALSSAVYIFVSSNNNRKEMILTERKLSRAVSFINKVKIKYVNNTNELDYFYQKYMVNSHEELKILWAEYVKANKEEMLFKNSTEQINISGRELIKELRNYELEDSGIWVYQAEAILDNKEMTQIRKRLEERRKKLRERIDYNNKLKDEGIEEIKRYIAKNPDKKQKMNESLKSFGIYNIW